MRKKQLLSIILFSLISLVVLQFMFTINKLNKTSSDILSSVIKSTELSPLDQKKLDTATLDAIEKRIHSMTLDQKVGQLFMIGHWKEDNYYHTSNMLRVYNFGGVIIMRATDEVLESVPIWTKSWIDDSTSIPPIIGIDQEGGVVNRIKAPEYLQTGQRDMFSLSQAHSIGVIRGAELTSLGINLNLAPVIDQSNIENSFLYKRTFADKNKTALYASALIEGMKKSNVIAVPKHYPGHYDNQDDSHISLPIIPISEAEFPEYTKYFTTLIKHNNPSILMTAHVLVPEIDPVFPATLSPKILQEKLRNDAGFSGVIMTDDMTMQAITNTWTTEEATLQALRAGADMILFAAKPNDAISAAEYILNAVDSGELPEERINESLRRIFKMKNIY